MEDGSCKICLLAGVAMLQLHVRLELLYIPVFWFSGLSETKFYWRLFVAYSSTVRLLKVSPYTQSISHRIDSMHLNVILLPDRRILDHRLVRCQLF